MRKNVDGGMNTEIMMRDDTEIVSKIMKNDHFAIDGACSNRLELNRKQLDEESNDNKIIIHSLTKQYSTKTEE